LFVWVECAAAPDKTGAPNPDKTGAPQQRPTLEAEVHPMKLFPGLTFSWKRALGITAAKRKISRKTGIPLTRQGRRSKLGKWMGMR
jgi:hypothetical protein